MLLAAMCVAALMLVGCGAEDAADDAREAVDPIAHAADKMAASGGPRVDGDMIVIAPDYHDAGKPQEVEVPDGDDVVDVTDELVEQID